MLKLQHQRQQRCLSCRSRCPRRDARVSVSVLCCAWCWEASHAAAVSISITLTTDATLISCERRLSPIRITITCLCGSMRFQCPCCCLLSRRTSTTARWRQNKIYRPSVLTHKTTLHDTRDLSRTYARMNLHYFTFEKSGKQINGSSIHVKRTK